MKKYFALRKTIGLCFLASCLYATTPLNKVQAIVKTALGSSVSIFDEHFVEGDFDGDGKSDLAVMVNVDDAKYGVLWRRVRGQIHLIDVDPTSKTNGSDLSFNALGHNCMGLLVVQDSQNFLSANSPSKIPTLSYACYSGFKVIKKSSEETRWLEFSGDRILLDMETGAQNMV